MKLKAMLLDDNSIRRDLVRISHEIIEKNRPNEKQFAFYTRKTDAQSFFDKGFWS